jgi:DNA-binding NtrC family response regulator
MERMTGLDLLKEIKDQHPEAMVVVMTSNASLETATTALRAGAYDYLIKPFDDIDMIAAVVNRAIDRYKLNAHNRALLEDLKRNKEEL